ncbi:MAG: hybrid sensor histidine kinase/response regulator [Anaerolineae bacterium]|nr:hybrid sensor histidine kinase/response regulator [Anaerolineae bacterium]
MVKPPDDLLNIFWIEAAEYLDALNRILLELEVAAPEADTTANLREICRVAHSLKGAARAVGQTTIETIAHQMESVFERSISGELALDPTAADVLYDGLDVIQIVAGGEDVDTDTVAGIVDRLVGISGQAALKRPAAEPAPAPDGQSAPDALAPAEVKPRIAKTRPVKTTQEIVESTVPRATEDTIRVSLGKLDELMGQASELLVARMRGELHRHELQALLQEHRRWLRTWRQVRAAYMRATRRFRNWSTWYDTDIRAPQDDGEGATDLRNLFLFIEATQGYMAYATRALLGLDRDLRQDNLRLASLIDDLQGDIARVRMLPFETILGTFQRMVRDLGREGGKDVTLVIEGAEVELDKHVLELLKDPLMHLLRNAVDHGVETPEMRTAFGKPANATITLRVQQRGNDIHIAVGDDGRGVDTDAVRFKALDAGLIGEAEAATLTTDEIAALVFEPGFSTAAQVTAVSGRGVGLDVVKRRIEALRGRLWLHNTPGSGATFHLYVPISLTRLRCLLARVGPQHGGEQYAIPLTAVMHIVNATPDEVFYVEDRPMLRVDGRPLPLVNLSDVLQRPVPPPPLGERTPILVLHSTDRTVAFVVDDLLSEQELVLKKLGDEMERVRNVTGAAILGTGEVVVVLNPGDLIKSARRTRSLMGEGEAEDELLEERPLWVLVVDDSLTTRTLEKNILEAAGYRVRTATDGEEALRVLMEHQPDVIVADVEMPNMDGFALTERVKSDARWREIPLILVTSLESEGHRERGLRAGADAYLVKARFDQDELLNVIDQMAG